MKILFALAIGILVVQPLGAAVMDSSNYSIERDSMNFGGGLSDSPSYEAESSFGEMATGYSDSANFNLHAGYQQMDGSFLTLNAVADVTLSPAIDGTVGGTANGDTIVTVTTDNGGGYELSIEADTAPALVSGGDSFADYTPAGADPDFTFSVPAAAAEFAFSPEGADIIQKYLDDGANCNAGATDTDDACWSALSIVDELISTSLSGNAPTGTVTTLEFRAASGASNTQPAGIYSATVLVTAVAL